MPIPSGNRYSGRVVKVLDRARARALGVYRELVNGAGRVLPIDKKGAAREIFIPSGLSGEAREGELVALEMLREGRFGLPSARVVERLGAVNTERAVSLIALIAHEIPHVFSAAALNRGRGGASGELRPSRGLARPAAGHDRSRRRQGSRRRRPRGAGRGPRKSRRLSCSPSRSPTSPITCSRDPSSTRKPWSAAIRFISPTASCRCCPSASPTISARCVRTRTGRRSRCE